VLKLLDNKDIDRSWWDDIISSSPQSDPYPYSWYLDIMCPGWKAYYNETNNAVMPVPLRSKVGIQYVYTPSFIQRLGVYISGSNKCDYLSPFIKRILADYALTDLCIYNSTESLGTDLAPRSNYYLDLGSKYDVLRQNFSGKCKRDIRLAKDADQDIIRGIAPSRAIDLFKNDLGKKISGIKPKDYSRLQKLMEYCIATGKGDIVGASVNDQLVYSLFYIKYSGKITALFISSTPESRSNRSGYYIINHLLEEFAASPLIFDFAGSSLKGVEKFILSFGSSKEEHYHLYNNNLKFMAKWAYCIKRRVLSR